MWYPRDSFSRTPNEMTNSSGDCLETIHCLLEAKRRASNRKRRGDSGRRDLGIDRMNGKKQVLVLFPVLCCCFWLSSGEKFARLWFLPLNDEASWLLFRSSNFLYCKPKIGGQFWRFRMCLFCKFVVSIYKNCISKISKLNVFMHLEKLGFS